MNMDRAIFTTMGAFAGYMIRPIDNRIEGMSLNFKIAYHLDYLVEMWKYIIIGAVCGYLIIYFLDSLVDKEMEKKQ